ncbi:acidic mammalian chitinase-like isoform X2 [Leptopilina heterotoma]|nr:acidic mammalian chitinase-like isoform X2 [Leptopilina heterotoma]
MRQLILVIATCLTYAVIISGQKRVVCYYASWATYRKDEGKYDIAKINPSLCSHLIYSFIGLNNDGTIKILDAWIDVRQNGFKNFNALRNKSPSTKTLAAIGGWAEGSEKFSNVVSNPGLRAKFINEAVKFLKTYGFNGLDLDWEYPGQRPGSRPTDKDNFSLLVKELKERFSREGLILSAAVNPTPYTAGLSYNIREISKHLDFINLMTYDYHGTNNDKRVGHNAPLFASPQETPDEKQLNCDASVKYWISQGAPREKINLGTAFYGRSFTLANPNLHKRGSPATGPGKEGRLTGAAGTLGYYEVCENTDKKGWKVEYDAEQHVVYAFQGNQIVGYDDVNSIKEKAQYVKNNNLGGAMIWSMDTDDFNGNCNGGKNPLLNALNKVLRN